MGIKLRSLGLAVLTAILVGFQNCTPSSLSSESVPERASASISPAAIMVDSDSPATMKLPAATTPAFVNAFAAEGWFQQFKANGSNRISFMYVNKTDVAAVDQSGTELWRKSVGEGALKGGFDLDADGVGDFAVFQNTPSASCNSYVLYNRSILFYSGATGAAITASSMMDKCILLSTGAYQSSATYSAMSLQFGINPGRVVLAPQYHGTGWFLTNQSATLAFVTPETAAYDLYSVCFRGFCSFVVEVGT